MWSLRHKPLRRPDLQPELPVHRQRQPGHQTGHRNRPLSSQRRRDIDSNDRFAGYRVGYAETQRNDAYVSLSNAFATRLLIPRRHSEYGSAPYPFGRYCERNHLYYDVAGRCGGPDTGLLLSVCDERRGAQSSEVCVGSGALSGVSRAWAV